MPARSQPIDLIITGVVPSRRGSQTAIKGTVVNTTGQPCEHSPLRILIRNVSGQIVKSGVIRPPAAPLGPYSAWHFETTLEHPLAHNERVSVGFA